jgi:hypothetical protein
MADEATTRIAELEAQVADLQARLAKRNNSNLERLKAYREANPEKAAESTATSAKRYKEAHREAYNARRRELYRLKRAAAMEQTPAATAPQ